MTPAATSGLIALAAAGGAAPGLWAMTWSLAVRRRYRQIRRLLRQTCHERDTLRFHLNLAAAQIQGRDAYDRKASPFPRNADRHAIAQPNDRTAEPTMLVAMIATTEDRPSA